MIIIWLWSYLKTKLQSHVSSKITENNPKIHDDDSMKIQTNIDHFKALRIYEKESELKPDSKGQNIIIIY